MSKRYDINKAMESNRTGMNVLFLDYFQQQIILMVLTHLTSQTKFENDLNDIPVRSMEHPIIIHEKKDEWYRMITAYLISSSIRCPHHNPIIR